MPRKLSEYPLRIQQHILSILQETDDCAFCPVCMAGCNFEAMALCALEEKYCPIIKRPKERFAGKDGEFEFLPAK